MSASAGPLCRLVPCSSSGRCCAPRRAPNWHSQGRRASPTALNSRRFFVDDGVLFELRLISSSSARGGDSGTRVRALQRDDEKRRFRSKPQKDAPRRPPDLDDELPLLRKTSRRAPSMEADVGLPPSRDGFSARDYEEDDYGDDEEDDDDDDDERPLSWRSVWKGVNRYILAGIFVLGIGAGITVDTVLNVEPNNVASREVIDRQTPNPDVCIANGMSAMVLDQRLFISFNPFNVYVSQTEVKPGCVLRQSNWSVLEARGLVTSDEVRDCKRNMNTFGFVGDLRQAPEISCVYHSETAENQFLKDPSKAALGDGFQPKDLPE